MFAKEFVRVGLSCCFYLLHLQIYLCKASNLSVACREKQYHSKIIYIGMLPLTQPAIVVSLFGTL